MTAPRSQAGFTLVELLVTMTIAVAGFAGVLGALHVMLTQSRTSQQINEAQDEARTAVDRLAVALRNAMAAPGVAPTAVERAGTDDLVFQTVDPAGTPSSANQLGAMRVRYCLDAADPSRGILRRQTQRWTTASAPPVPAATACDAGLNGWDDNRAVVSDLVNRARAQAVWVFGRPVTVPPDTSLANIRSIETSLIVDIDPRDARGERRLTGGVALRNANRPPIAAFTYSRVGGFIVANGSASTDEDGDGLEYQWWVDGSPLAGATTSKLQVGLTPGSHVLKLVVTDPSGLTGETSRTVPG